MKNGKLKTSGKRKTAVLLILAAFAVCGLAAVPFVLKAVIFNDSTAERIKTEIETQVGKAINEPLSLGKLEFDLAGRLHAGRLSLGRPGRQLVKDGELTIRLNWLELIRKRTTPEKAISSIVVTGANVFVYKDSAGNWNYPHPKPTGKKAAAYPAIDVTIEHAKLEIVDDFATPSIILRRATAEDISGTFKLRGAGDIFLNATALNTTFCTKLDVNMYFNGGGGWTFGGNCKGLNPVVPATLFRSWNVTVATTPVDVDFIATAKYNGRGNHPNYFYRFKTDMDSESISLDNYGIRLSGPMKSVEFTGYTRYHGRRRPGEFAYELKAEAAGANVNFPNQGIALSGVNGSVFLLASAGTATATAGNDFTYTLKSAITSANAVFKQYDITLAGLSGGVEYADSEIRLNNIKSKWAGGNVSGQGMIQLTGSPLVSMRIEADKVNLSNGGNWVKNLIGGYVGGAVTGTVFVNGPPSDPELVVNAKADHFSYPKFSADAIEAAFIYSKHKVEVDYVKLASGQGGLEMTGSALLAKDFSPQQYSGVVRFNKIDVARICKTFGVEIKGHPITGLAGGEVMVSKAADRKLPDVAGSATAQNLTVAPFETADTATVSFSYKNEALMVDNLVATGKSTYLLAHGNVSGKGIIDINIEGAETSVVSVLDLLGRKDIKNSGKLRLKGTLTGTIGKPVLAGVLDAGDILVSTLAIEHLTGGIEISPDGIQLKKFEVKSGGNTHTADGGWYADGRIDMRLKVNGADVNNVLSLMHDIADTPVPDVGKLGGNVFADMKITGTATDPIYDVGLAVTDLAMYDEKIATATANLHYDKELLVDSGKLILSPEEPTQVPSMLKFSGKVSKDGALNLDIFARRMRLDDLNYARTNRVSGTIDITGKIGGTTKSPTMSSLVSSPKFKLRGMDLKVEPVTLIYMNDQAIFNNITMHRAMETYVATGTYDFAASTLNLYLKFSDASPDTVSKYLGKEFPPKTNGKLDGNIHMINIGGTMHGTMEVHGHDMNIADFPLTKGDLLGEFEGDKLQITQFEASNETTEFSGNGAIDLSAAEKSLVNLKATKLDLGLFANMGLLPESVKGLADIDVAVTSNGGNSYMSGSIYAYDLSYAGITFEQARGSFDFKDDMLRLSDLQVIKNKQRLIFRGEIPYAKAGSGDKRFQIICSSKNFDLATFNPALEKYGIALQGPVEMKDVYIRGSLDNPLFSGEIAVRNATLTYADISKPIENINGTLVAENSTLRLESLTGMINGQPLQVAGMMYFKKGLTPDHYELAITDVTNLSIEYKKLYKGLIDVHGLKFTGGMTGITLISAQGQTPSISFHDGLYTLPAVGEASALSTSTYVFGIQEKGLVVNVGRNMTVKTEGTNLSVTPSGSIRLSGNLARPDIKGYLTAAHGYMWLSALNIWFKLNEEAVIGFYTIDPVGVVPLFHALATAHKSGMDINLEVSGPLLDLAQYPEYEKMCGSGKEDAASGRLTSAIGGPSVNIGGSDVSICPSFKLTGTTSDGTTMSNEQLMRKLTLTDSAPGGTNVGTIARDQFRSLIGSSASSYVEKYGQVDNFDLSLDPNKDIFVQLEKCVRAKVCLRYERLFAQQEKELGEILYKFRKKSFLLFGIDQNYQYHYQVEYRLNF